MKIVVLVALAAMIAVSPVSADESISSTDIRLFVSTGFVFPLGGVTYIGVEYPIYSWSLADAAIVSIQAAAALQLAYAVWKDLWSYATIGAGFFATASVSFPGRLEIYLSPGFGINYYIYAGDPSYYVNREVVQPGFAGLASVRYRFSDTFRAGIDLVYWGEYIGPNIGLGFSLSFE